MCKICTYDSAKTAQSIYTPLKGECIEEKGPYASHAFRACVRGLFLGIEIPGTPPADTLSTGTPPDASGSRWTRREHPTLPGITGQGLRSPVDPTAIGMADITGLDELMAAFDRLPQQVKAAAVRGVSAGAILVHRDAVRNAPRSPLQRQKNAQRKTTADTSKRRKTTATTRAKPQGLERSISFAVDASKLEGSVFVSANSEAGKYAKRIHDERYKSWQNLGAGSRGKPAAGGQGVGEKFIERAVDANAVKVGQRIDHELNKVEL